MTRLAFLLVFVAGYFAIMAVMSDRSLVAFRARCPHVLFLAGLTLAVGMPLGIAFQLALEGPGSANLRVAAGVTAGTAAILVVLFGGISLVARASGYRAFRASWQEAAPGDAPARLAAATPILVAEGFDIVVSEGSRLVARRSQASAHAIVGGPDASLLYATCTSRGVPGTGLTWIVDVRIGTQVLWDSGERELCRSIGQRVVAAMGGPDAPVTPA